MHLDAIRELDEIGAGAINCPTCGARGVFGYRHPVDGMRWYCSDHRLGQWYADARR
jgi:hypothetical protein